MRVTRARYAIICCLYAISMAYTPRRFSAACCYAAAAVYASAATPCYAIRRYERWRQLRLYRHHNCCYVVTLFAFLSLMIRSAGVDAPPDCRCYAAADGRHFFAAAAPPRHTTLARFMLKRCFTLLSLDITPYPRYSHSRRCCWRVMFFDARYYYCALRYDTLRAMMPAFCCC